MNSSSEKPRNRIGLAKGRAERYFDVQTRDVPNCSHRKSRLMQKENP